MGFREVAVLGALGKAPLPKESGTKRAACRQSLVASRSFAAEALEANQG